MSIIDSIAKLFFGDKAANDMKEVTPLVEKIKEQAPRIAAFTNDELRNETLELRRVIAERIAPIEEEIELFKAKIESEEIGISEKEDLGKQIDKLNKDLDETIEQVLLEILPTAFSIVKETAKRFFENKQIEVTATTFDQIWLPKKIL